jgi:hypothetical protein
MAALEDIFGTFFLKNVISLLTLIAYGLIPNFGVNFLPMSASSDFDPHPSCPQGRRRHLTALQPLFAVYARTVGVVASTSG